MENNNPASVIAKHEDKDKQIFFIRFVINEVGVNLLILRDGVAFFALASNEDINKQAASNEMEPDVYFANLKQYLEYDKENISYSVSQSAFIIYRLINKIKIKFFQASTEKCDYSTNSTEFIDELLNRSAGLSQKLFQMENQNENLSKEKEGSYKKLEELVQAKRYGEKKLISSFLLVLNEKKKRIQYLNDLLDAFRSGRSLTNPVASKKRRKNGGSPRVVKERVSESSDDDYNSEDEKKKIKPTVAVASTSREYLDDNIELIPKEVSVKLPQNKQVVAQKEVPSTKSADDLTEPEKTEKNHSSRFDTQDLLDLL